MLLSIIMGKVLKTVVILTTAWHIVICCPEKCACLPNPGGGIQALCVGVGFTSVPSGDLPPSTTHLYISSNSISVINASDFSHLENLVALDLSYNVIELIDKTAFLPLTKLTYLNLERNKIFSLETTHFRSLAKLETLYIGSNADLMLHGPCTLSSLGNLRKLSLTNSPITFGLYLFGNTTSCSESHCNTLTDSSMCHLPLLDELDISYTATGNVPVELFGLMPNLRILSLAGNDLSDIQDGSFYDLVVLEELTLNYNNLTYVSRRTFNGTTNLIKLELGNEGLFVAPGVFDDMPNLTELSLTLLGQTVIDSLAHVVGNTSITKLNLHHNFLTSIPVSMSHIPSLTSLDLSQNLITHLPANEFTTSLTDLDLSYNDIATINVETFSGLSLINTLSLCNNSLETLPSLVFEPLPPSAKICLGENPWNCSCEMKDIITDERHHYSFPYGICSSPAELQGMPFSALTDTDIFCPITTVTYANPTTKANSISTPAPTLTLQSRSITSPTPTYQSPSTRVTRKTKTRTPYTTLTTELTSSQTPRGTTKKLQRSTVRTLPRATDKSSTTALAETGTSDNTFSTAILVIILILVTTVIALSVIALFLWLKKMPRKSNQVNTSTNNHFLEGGLGNNGPLPTPSTVPPQFTPSSEPPPIYEEIPQSAIDNHFYLDGPNSYLLPNIAPAAVSEPLKSPDVSVIFSVGACNNQTPPPPYLEDYDDTKPPVVYDTSIVNATETNQYDTKISEL